MRKINYILSVIISLFVANTGYAGFSTSAKSVYLVDYDSGTELVTKNSDELMPPSSMIKLMTLVVLFDEIKAGNIEMDDRFPVSENADYKNPVWDTASKICLERGQTVSVRDLVSGLIVLSGGDSAVVVAEKLAGSESAFTTKMQKKARELGMNKSLFGNASGLPNPNNLMTTKELGILGTHIISDYPDLYPLFSARRFEFNEYKSDWCRTWGSTHNLNYNKLIFIMPGADGLKTGHTDEGGYGMVASAKVGGRRLVGVINGFKGKNHDALAAEMKKLMNYGYANTSNKIFYHAGDKIVDVPVWYGRRKTVTGTVARQFAVTLKSGQAVSGLRVVARYDEPVVAPIKAGQQIGEIIAEMNGEVIARAPLVANEKVGKTQLLGRVFRNLSVLFSGK